MTIRRRTLLTLPFDKCALANSQPRSRIRLTQPQLKPTALQPSAKCVELKRGYVRPACAEFRRDIGQQEGNTSMPLKLRGKHRFCRSICPSASRQRR